jgi:23S rRNA pseudouridine1911/1915/1917 synthase
MAVTPKNSKESITKFKVVRQLNGFALVECELITGRTHQIRVHMAYINHAIVGDYIYGHRSQFDGFGPYLHALSLKFIHPITKKQLEFKAYEPQEFTTFAETISSN